MGDEDLGRHQRSDSSRHLGHALDTRCDSSQACAYNQAADRKFKNTFAALLRRQLGSVSPSALRQRPRRTHGASRTPSAARQPRQRAPAPGIARHSTAPLGLDARRKMG